MNRRPFRINVYLLLRGSRKKEIENSSIDTSVREYVANDSKEMGGLTGKGSEISARFCFGLKHIMT